MSRSNAKSKIKLHPIHKVHNDHKVQTIHKVHNDHQDSEIEDSQIEDHEVCEDSEIEVYEDQKRIGLYGGSFDPIHIGHLLAAQSAFEELELHRLFFIPSALSPFKLQQKILDASWRLRLIRVALEAFPNFEISELEIEKGGTSFSIDTIRYFTNAFSEAEIFYLIGADHLQTLPQWKDAKEVARLVCFAIIPRPGAPNEDHLTGFQTVKLKGFPIEISSSLIRSRARKGLQLVPFLLPNVAELIDHHHLYSQNEKLQK